MSAAANIETRTCAKCQEPKLAADFYASSGRTCKVCVRARVRDYRAANIERIRARDRSRGQTEERKARVREYSRRVQADPEMRAHRNELRRAWSHNNKQQRRELNEAYKKKYPGVRRAHRAVAYALETGALTRGVCEECGAGTVHAHHDDYSKPLEVRWLCPWHHRLWHRDNGPGANLS